ncbi:MAG: hypothetical protein WCG60_02235 [bacterium]
MINILIVLILYALVFVGGEVAYRKFHMPFLFSRKLSHISGSIVSFLLPYFVSHFTAVGIGLLFTLVIFFSKKKNYFKSIHDKGCLSIGEVIYPLGIALSAFFIWPLSIIAYQGSCLVLGLSDGFAGYFGTKYGKKDYCIAKGRKTIEGTIIFYIFTVIIFLIYSFLYSSQISTLGVILVYVYALYITFIEALFSGGWDNLIIPFTAGSALLLIVS